MFVYPNVINKLRSKRINIDKLTPDKMADIMYSAIHNTKSRVMSTKYPHIQSIDRITQNIKKTNTAYLGKKDKTISIKSAYLQDLSSINKLAFDGADQRSM